MPIASSYSDLRSTHLLHETLQVLKRAIDVYDGIRARIGAGVFRTEPYPIPAGYRSHSIAMISLRVTQVLADAAAALDHPRRGELAAATMECASQIVNDFCLPDGAIQELVPVEESLADTLLARHATPGHMFESMWFVIRTAVQYGHAEWIATAAKAIAWAFHAGWDSEWGGLFRYIDRSGGRPAGVAGVGAV